MRPSSSARGYTTEWRRYRVQYLKAHPHCVHCKQVGRTVAATHVDHIEPHNGDPILMWSEENHQGLCAGHHSSKTNTIDGGFGNDRRARPLTIRPKIAKGCDADGNPTDPGHSWNNRSCHEEVRNVSGMGGSIRDQVGSGRVGRYPVEPKMGANS
jgi:hypothetical protein